MGGGGWSKLVPYFDRYRETDTGDAQNGNHRSLWDSGAPVAPSAGHCLSAGRANRAD